MHHVALELPENDLICLFYCATEIWHDVFYCRSKWGTGIFFLYSPLNSWSVVQTSMSQQWKDHVLLLSPFNVLCLPRLKESKVNTSWELFYVMKNPDKYMNHKYILNISDLVLQGNIITFFTAKGFYQLERCFKQSKAVRPISCTNKNKLHLYWLLQVLQYMSF